jgi:pyridoxal phosphate enzyme (YggS family)
MSSYDERLADALPNVRARIADARQRAGMTASPVRIVAVTKTHPAEAVRAALAAGLQDFGENRVQELEVKVAELGRTGAVWHLIGHLQRNKARKALTLFDLIHSVDSVELARDLAKEAVRAGITVHALVQVNTSGEETKSGFDAGGVVDAVAVMTALEGLAIDGLMTMAPFTDDERVLRSTFASARAALEACRARMPTVGPELSMGMSNDYEVAVEEGSTIVRLGTVLFGHRA